MKNKKNLIAGLTALTILSTPLYSHAGVKEDIAELKEVIPQILLDDEISHKSLENDDYSFKIDVSFFEELKFEVYNKKSERIYRFRDEGCDGDLDLYISDEGYSFTSENTNPEYWERLEKKYQNFVSNTILPLAKKILNERNSSLDKDLETM